MPALVRPLEIPEPRRFPARIGRFQILMPIGFGGMATVFLARFDGPAGVRREVALKWVSAIAPGYADLATHLLREARIVGRIRHPHVVQLIDAGADADGIFLAMEYVEGGTLAALSAAALERGERVPLSIALRVVSDALLGLHAAHELRDDEGRAMALVHRDFSPHNVLIGVQGDVKVADFGIAKVEHTSHRTRTGLVKGTVSYMSPEQVRGQPLDRRSDLWSAGVVAWELFAGQPFHQQREGIAAAMNTLTGKIPRLRSARAELPEALDEAVATALSRSAQRRFESALVLRERLLATAGVAPASSEELAVYAQGVFAAELSRRHARLEEARDGKRESAREEGEAFTARRSERSPVRTRERRYGMPSRWPWIAGALALCAALGALLSLRAPARLATTHVPPTGRALDSRSTPAPALPANDSTASTAPVSATASARVADSAVAASASARSGRGRGLVVGSNAHALPARPSASSRVAPAEAAQRNAAAAPNEPSARERAAPPLAENPYARSHVASP